MKNIFLSITAMILFSCNSENSGDIKENQSDEKDSLVEHEILPAVQLEDLYFMTGLWIDSSNSMEGFHEKWIVQGDSLMEIIGFYANNKDTAIMESIKVKMINGVLNYIPVVENQNEGKPVYFAIQEGSNSDSFVFANYKHDFPREIIYVKRNNNSVDVFLNGVDKNGLSNNFFLPLKRKE